MILLKNGYLYDPKSGTEGERDVLTDGEKIVRIQEPGSIDPGKLPSDTQILDLTGCCVAPGLVDIHVHFRDPGYTYKEDIESGAAAAAAGGFTSVVLMANTKPAGDTEETLSYVIGKGKKTGIHVYTCGTVTKGLKGRELTDMEALCRAGAVGFTDDGVPLLQEELVRAAMREAVRLDVPLSFHEEDPVLIADNGINAGRAAAHFGIGGSPREAETALIERDLELALETGAKVNIQHISTREGVELVRRAKAGGGYVYAEATPHHFSLTEEAAIRYGSMAKMNPPLRGEEDRLAIIDGLKDGTIDFITTDHAPHSREEKAQEITKAPSGIIGLETALSLGITYLVETGELSVQELLSKMTWKPASLYKLDAGYLAEGGPADLTVFKRDEEYVAGDFVSKSSNSPFIGQKLKGRIQYTVCAGKIIYALPHKVAAAQKAERK